MRRGALRDPRAASLPPPCRPSRCPGGCGPDDRPSPRGGWARRRFRPAAGSSRPPIRSADRARRSRSAPPRRRFRSCNRSRTCSAGRGACDPPAVGNPRFLIGRRAGCLRFLAQPHGEMAPGGRRGSLSCPLCRLAGRLPVLRGGSLAAMRQRDQRTEGGSPTQLAATSVSVSRATAQTAAPVATAAATTRSAITATARAAAPATIARATPASPTGPPAAIRTTTATTAAAAATGAPTTRSARRGRGAGAGRASTGRTTTARTIRVVTAAAVTAAAVTAAAVTAAAVTAAAVTAVTAAAAADLRGVHQARLPSGGRAFCFSRPDRGQRRARRDHFLRKLQLQQGGPSGRKRALEGRRELLGGLDELAEGAERARVRGEVGILEPCPVDAAGIAPLLVHPDGSVATVVHDQDDHR